MSERAICWEMTCDRDGIQGARLLVAGRCFGLQVLSRANQRPIWAIEVLDSAPAAMERSLAVTSEWERLRGARLSVEPGEVILHDSELQTLLLARTIPSALRARVFTSLLRRRDVG